MKSITLLFLCVVMLPLSVSATLIGDTINGDLRGSDADGSVVVSNTDIEFTHTDFGFNNDIWTADFSDNFFTLKVEVVGPEGNISGGPGFQWSFSDFDWLGFPDSEIIDVRLVSFVGPSFSTDTDISFTKDSITINSGILDLIFSDSDRQFSSGTFQIIASHEVSEPIVISIMGLGLIGLCYRRRKAQ
jgi:hypothetical protein